MGQDRIDRFEVAGTSTVQDAELRAARRRIVELEAELTTVMRASELFGERRVVRPKALFGVVESLAREGLGTKPSVGCCEFRRRGSSGGVPRRRLSQRSGERGSPTSSPISTSS